MNLVHSSESEDHALFMYAEKHSPAGHELQSWSENNTEKKIWPSEISKVASSFSFFPPATDSLGFGFWFLYYTLLILGLIFF